jgi:hypothetical protein
MQPLPDAQASSWREQQLDLLGYCLVPGAIPRPLLTELQERLDALFAKSGQQMYPHAPGSTQGAECIELSGLFDLDPAFDVLMDLDPAFGLAERALNGDITLNQGGLAHLLPGGANAHCGWHRDGPDPYVRLTWLLDDVEVDRGPTALIPGSHRWPESPPPWANAADGQPRALPGQVLATGRAGDCLINHTRIWHTNTPNTSARGRKVIWVVFKRSCFKQWNDRGEGRYTLSRAVAARQVEPRRQRLCAVDFVR